MVKFCGELFHKTLFAIDDNDSFDIQRANIFWVMNRILLVSNALSTGVYNSVSMLCTKLIGHCFTITIDRNQWDCNPWIVNCNNYYTECHTMFIVNKLTLIQNCVIVLGQFIWPFDFQQLATVLFSKYN